LQSAVRSAQEQHAGEGERHDRDKGDEAVEHDTRATLGRVPTATGWTAALLPSRHRNCFPRGRSAGRLVVGPERRERRIEDADLIAGAAAIDVAPELRRRRPA
jgi:hypothetical protein